MLSTDLGKMKDFGPRSRDFQGFKAITFGQV